MGIIQSSVAEHASPSQRALMTGLGISVTRLRSEDLTERESVSNPALDMRQGDGDHNETASGITGPAAARINIVDGTGMRKFTHARLPAFTDSHIQRSTNTHTDTKHQNTAGISVT